MQKVMKPRSTFVRTTGRDLRALMRQQGITVEALAWILPASRTRAFLLRYVWSNWTLREVSQLMWQTAPASASVPVWGELVKGRG